MNPFYGNQLVQQIISNKKLRKLTSKNKNRVINLDKNDFFNLINICTGLYSPLTGFCDYKNYCSIIKENKLNNKLDWTIPILLNFPLKKKSYTEKSYFGLKYKSKLVGIIKVKDIYKINKKLFNKKIFGTNSKKHPGVALMKKKRNFFIGGKTYLLNTAVPKEFYFRFPKINRHYLSGKNNSNAAFSTRNICHSGHALIQQYILKKVKILYVVIIENSNNKYDPKILFETYEMLIRKMNLKNKMKIISIPMPTFFAGPKEAFLQAVIMQNLGFSNFIVGRDHAGVKDFYEKYASQKIFKKFRHLDIKILKTKEPRICTNCNNVIFYKGVNQCKTCSSRSKIVGINGKYVKQKIKEGDFSKLKGLINPYLISYFKLKKNLNKIRNLKG